MSEARLAATRQGSAGAATSVREFGVSFIEGVRLIASREVGAYFDSSIAYVYTIAFLVLANSIFMNEFFLVGTAEMTGFFERMPLLLAFFLPAITSFASWSAISGLFPKYQV